MTAADAAAQPRGLVWAKDLPDSAKTTLDDAKKRLALTAHLDALGMSELISAEMRVREAGRN